MTEDEMIARCMAGETIVANVKLHKKLINWARKNGKYAPIHRNEAFNGINFGNPFIMKSEYDRDKVCDQYAQYLKSNSNLINLLPMLKGKVLGCYCAPKRCHGNEIIKLLYE